jgi:hypothetical protein
MLSNLCDKTVLSAYDWTFGHSTFSLVDDVILHLFVYDLNLYKDQSPCGGQLEVGTSSYDVNFHCDFWNFLRR